MNDKQVNKLKPKTLKTNEMKKCVKRNKLNQKGVITYLKQT